MTELAMEDPLIQKMIDNQGTPSREVAFSFYILCTCSHAHAMVQRKVLDDNEWAGWLQRMRNCFRKGAIKETWKQVEQDRRFDPAFQNFMNTDMVGAKLRALSKIIIKSDQLSNTCGFPFKTAFSKFQSCWFALTAVSSWSSSSSTEAISLLSYGGNLWTQQAFTCCADIAYNFEPKNRVKFDLIHPILISLFYQDSLVVIKGEQEKIE
jgi:hypothetical protein